LSGAAALGLVGENGELEVDDMDMIYNIFETGSIYLFLTTDSTSKLLLKDCLFNVNGTAVGLVRGPFVENAGGYVEIIGCNFTGIDTSSCSILMCSGVGLAGVFCVFGITDSHFENLKSFNSPSVLICTGGAYTNITIKKIVIDSVSVDGSVNGGLMMVNSGEGAIFVMSDSDVSNVTVSLNCNGGVVNLQGELSLLCISQNFFLAVKGSNYGGVLCINLTGIESESSLIDENEFDSCESKYGGGICILNKPIQLIKCEFKLNIAYVGGQDVYYELNENFYNGLTVIECCSTGGHKLFLVDGGKEDLSELLGVCVQQKLFVRNDGENKDICIEESSPCETIEHALKKSSEILTLIVVLGIEKNDIWVFESSNVELQDKHLKICSKNQQEIVLSFESEQSNSFFIVNNGTLYVESLICESHPDYSFFFVTNGGKIQVTKCKIKGTSLSQSFAVMESGSVFIYHTNITAISLTGRASLFEIKGPGSVTFSTVRITNVESSSETGGIISDLNAATSDPVKVYIYDSVVASFFYKHTELSSHLLNVDVSGAVLTLRGGSSSLLHIIETKFMDIGAASNNNGMNVKYGVVYALDLGELFIDSCEFNNVKDCGSGAGIRVESCVSTVIKGCQFISCISRDKGGAIFFGSNVLFTVMDSLFKECSVLSQNGAGGALFSDSNAVGIKHLIRLRFEDNTVKDGRSNDIADNSTHWMDHYSFESVEGCTSTSSSYKFHLLQDEEYLDCLLEVCFFFSYFLLVKGMCLYVL
jgi:hypothetical protein